MLRALRLTGERLWLIGRPMATASQRRRRPSAPRKAKTRLTSKTADKHDLYQKSVQDPPNDIRFMRRIYKKENAAEPVLLREDFCGTALMCADWVRQNSTRLAIGLDLHRPTLEWGRKNNIAPLGEAAARVRLLQANVLDPLPERADIIAAFNFSYCIFKTRDALVDYFRRARAGLSGPGMFIMDIHGGVETTIETDEETEHKDFTYVWEQAIFDAVNGFGKRYIHFRFKDGTEIHRAFTYDWRIWTLPEVKDCLVEAGYSRVDVYWEGADEDGDGNGIFRKVKRADEEDSWISYVVAWR